MPLDIFKAFQQRDTLTPFIRIIAGDDSQKAFYYETDNALMSCGIFRPLSGWNEQIGTAAESALGNNLPPGSFIGFQQINHPDIEADLETFLGARNAPSTDPSVLIAREAVKERADFLRLGTRHQLIRDNDSTLLNPLCVWFIKIPIKTSNPFASNAAFAKFKKELGHFIQLRDSCLSQLGVAGIHPSLLDRGGMLSLLRRWLDMFGQWDNHVDDDIPLNEQLCPAASQANWDKMFCKYLSFKGFNRQNHNQNVGILAIDRLPSEERPWHMSYMADLLGHPKGMNPQPGMPFIISTIIHYPDQDAKHRKLGTSRMNSVLIRKKSPNATEISPKLGKQSRGFQKMAQDLTDGGRIVETAMSVLFFHHNRNKIKKVMDSMAAYYDSKGFAARAEWVRPNINFFNSLTGNMSAESIKRTARFHTMTSDMAAHLLPVFGEWQGFGDEMLLFTRRNKLFKYSIFHGNNLSYNGMTVGGMGAGKTFFSQHMLDALLSLNVKVWAIDTGSSLMASARNKKAQIIDFHDNADLCLNPFTRITDIKKETEILLPLLGKMAKPNEGLNDIQNAALTEAIRLVFTKKGNESDIDDIIEFLWNQNGQLADVQHELAVLLTPFGSSGHMGRWFKGKNNLRSEANYAVVELSGLATNKHLHDVILMMVAMNISQEMFMSRDNIRRILWLGECGDLLKSIPFASFATQLSSKIRKEDGSIWFEMQNINQAFQTHYGPTILANCYTRFFLRQDPSALEEAERKGWFIPPPYVKHLLSSLHTAKGRYAEVLVQSGDAVEVARVVETPFNRILYNTEGELFKELQRRVRNQEDVAEFVTAEAKRQYGDGAFY